MVTAASSFSVLASVGTLAAVDTRPNLWCCGRLQNKPQNHQAPSLSLHNRPKYDGSWHLSRSRLCPVQAVLNYLISHSCVEGPVPLLVWEDGSPLRRVEFVQQVHHALTVSGIDIASPLLQLQVLESRTPGQMARLGLCLLPASPAGWHHINPGCSLTHDSKQSPSLFDFVTWHEKT